jgi:hypothetical protein
MMPENELNSHRKPILVTGAHRTGTTWVGKMLAAAGGITYISEPLNVLHRPGVMRAPTCHWYTYICPENESEYLPALLETLNYRYHAWAEIRSLRSRKDLLRMGRDWSAFLRGRLERRRALIKDPFAVFSIPWFVERFDCPVVVTVRHPAAFASSLKRLDWSFDFTDLLAQPLLMRDWLEPYRAEMETLQTGSPDVLAQGGLLWRMVYALVAECRRRFSQVRVVRHEDLSLDPLQGYRLLYDDLGLAFTPRVEGAILDSSSSENPKELSKQRTHAVRLDSRANLSNWKRRLAPEEIARLRWMTGEVAAEYGYTNSDWE